MSVGSGYPSAGPLGVRSGRRDFDAWQPAPRTIAACPIGLRFFSQANMYEHRKSDDVGRSSLKKGCTRNQMVLGTASATVETTVKCQLPMTASEGDF